ncbi:putative reverse transcriptase domain-containing protein, partial [Tanacetum coccineum]
MPPRRLLKKVSVKRLVEKRVAKAIEEYKKFRANLDGAGSSGGNNGNAGRTVNVQGCSHKTFLNGKPHSFKGTECVVGLRRWIEKAEQVFETGKLFNAKYSMDEFKMMMDTVLNCPLLALMCPELVPTKRKKIEKYVHGFPERIKGNITFSKPVTLHDAITGPLNVEQWFKCKNAGPSEKDCRVRPPGAGVYPYQDVTCLGCVEKRNFRNMCPKAGNQQNVGARARAYAVGENPQQNPNVVADYCEKIVRIPLRMASSLKSKSERRKRILDHRAVYQGAEKKLDGHSGRLSETSLKYFQMIVRFTSGCYYRRFIKNFSKIAKPLTLLTQKNKTFVWGDEQEEAFRILKEKLCNAPVLALPDRPNDFVVYCDASKLETLSFGTKSVIYNATRVSSTYFDQKELNMAKAVDQALSDYECEIHNTTRARQMWWPMPCMGEQVPKISMPSPNGKEGRNTLLKTRNGESTSLIVCSQECTLDLRDLYWWTLETTEKIFQIKERLKTARSRQKSYIDKRRKPLEFEVGDRVLLRYPPWKEWYDLVRKESLAPRSSVIAWMGGRGGFDEDGILVVNGLLERYDWPGIPLGAIPAGTRNGMIKYLLVSISEPCTPVNAILAAIRGHKCSFDVATIRQGETVFFSVLMLAWGLISDIDIESDKYRWMGCAKIGNRVTCQSDYFLDKNKVYVFVEHHVLMNASKCFFVSSLFPHSSQDSSISSKFTSIAPLVWTGILPPFVSFPQAFAAVLSQVTGALTGSLYYMAASPK